MGFNLVRLVITIRSSNCFQVASVLPFIGSSYAELCRSRSCAYPERTCGRCSQQHLCGWQIIFGQKLTADAVALKRYQKPPLPFVFSFPPPDSIKKSDDEVTCDLTVIGHAIPYLSLLMQGFSELLAHGLGQVSALVVRVDCRDFQGSIQRPDDVITVNKSAERLVPEELVIASSDGLLESRTWDCSEIHLRCITPLRLVEDGHSMTRFDFSRFARSVMRRVSSLTYYYGENELEWDFKELARLIDEVICTDCSFQFTKDTQRKISGITGQGHFLGDFNRLAPFLVIGSFVHTGKGASYGMGQFEINPEA